MKTLEHHQLEVVQFSLLLTLNRYLPTGYLRNLEQLEGECYL